MLKQTRGNLGAVRPPTHHGTTLKLLSTDCPSAVTHVPA